MKTNELIIKLDSMRFDLEKQIRKCEEQLETVEEALYTVQDLDK